MKKRVYLFVGIGSITLSIFCWLVTRTFLPMFPTMLIVPPVLFVAAWLVLFRPPRRKAVPTGTFRLSKMMWVLVVVYTIALVVGVVNWIRLRNMESAIQAIGGMIVPAFLWITVYRVQRFNKQQSDKHQPQQK